MSNPKFSFSPSAPSQSTDNELSEKSVESNESNTDSSPETKENDAPRSSFGLSFRVSHAATKASSSDGGSSKLFFGSKHGSSNDSDAKGFQSLFKANGKSAPSSATAMSETTGAVATSSFAAKFFKAQSPADDEEESAGDGGAVGTAPSGVGKGPGQDGATNSERHADVVSKNETATDTASGASFFASLKLRKAASDAPSAPAAEVPAGTTEPDDGAKAYASGDGFRGFKFGAKKPTTGSSSVLSSAGTASSFFRATAPSSAPPSAAATAATAAPAATSGEKHKEGAAKDSNSPPNVSPVAPAAVQVQQTGTGGELTPRTLMPPPPPKKPKAAPVATTPVPSAIAPSPSNYSDTTAVSTPSPSAPPTHSQEPQPPAKGSNVPASAKTSASNSSGKRTADQKPFASPIEQNVGGLSLSQGAARPTAPLPSSFGQPSTPNSQTALKRDAVPLALGKAPASTSISTSKQDRNKVKQPTPEQAVRPQPPSTPGSGPAEEKPTSSSRSSPHRTNDSSKPNKPIALPESVSELNGPLRINEDAHPLVASSDTGSAAPPDALADLAQKVDAVTTTAHTISVSLARMEADMLINAREEEVTARILAQQLQKLAMEVFGPLSISIPPDAIASPQAARDTSVLLEAEESDPALPVDCITSGDRLLDTLDILSADVPLLADALSVLYPEATMDGDDQCARPPSDAEEIDVDDTIVRILERVRAVLIDEGDTHAPLVVENVRVPTWDAPMVC